MTRRLVLFGAPMLAAGADEIPETAIQWRTFSTENAVAIPTASDFLTRFGVSIDVHTDRPQTEAFAVTCRYLDSGDSPREQTKIVTRDRGEAREGWTSLCVYTGEPVRVLSVRVRELASVHEALRAA